MSSSREGGVIHLSEALAGGVLEVVRRVANETAKAGLPTSVIYTRRIDTPADEDLRGLFDPNVRLICAGSGNKVRSAWLLARHARSVLRSSRTSLVHAHSSVAGVSARVVAGSAISRDRVLYSPHGFAFLKLDAAPVARRFYRMIEWALARRCNALVLVSKSEGDEAASLHPRRTHVIANGVDRPVQPGSDSPARDRPLVGCVGRFVPQKAPDLFDKVAAALTGEAEFVWIGGDASRDHLSAARVVAWSSRDQVLSLVAGMDVFLLLSRWEGMPLALIEAQMLGIPAVASDVVGNRDVVVDGATGYLVTDLDEAVERVRILIRDSALRSSMAVASIQNSQRFEAARMVSEYRALYEELLSDAAEL